MRPSAAQWAAYLARYHDEHPGITEDVLGPARDGAGRSPYDWLVEAAPRHGLVVDLGCGSAPVGRCLATGTRYVGVDRSHRELRRARPVAVARADGAALPLADATADAVVASMVLMVMPRLDAALDEVRRVLRPGGALVATVAVRAVGDDPSTSVFRELLAALGQSQVRYPGSPTAGALPSRLAGAGLELRADACGRFTRTVEPDDCEVVVDSFYAIGTRADERAEALARLRARAAAGPFPLTYPIRRLVAVRR